MIDFCNKCGSLIFYKRDYKDRKFNSEIKFIPYCPRCSGFHIGEFQRSFTFPDKQIKDITVVIYDKDSKSKDWTSASGQCPNCKSIKKLKLLSISCYTRKEYLIYRCEMCNHSWRHNN